MTFRIGGRDRKLERKFDNAQSNGKASENRVNATRAPALINISTIGSRPKNAAL